MAIAFKGKTSSKSVTTTSPTAPRYPDLPKTAVEMEGWWEEVRVQLTRQATASDLAEVGNELDGIESNVTELKQETDRSLAIIREALEVRATETEALARRTTTIEAEVRTQGEGSTTLTARVQKIEQAYATQEFAEARIMEAVTAAVRSAASNTTAMVREERVARATETSALAESILTLSATVDGIEDVSATVNILAGAYIVDGAAIATYGFKLDANGKVVGMQAIAASGGTQDEVAEIVFIGADLRSDNFATGIAGWKIGYDGSVEFNDVVIRGLVKASQIDHACTFIRQPDGIEGGQLFLQMPAIYDGTGDGGGAGAWALDVYSDGHLRVFIEGNPSIAGTKEFEVQGDVRADAYLTPSSKRLKDNVRTIEAGVLDDLLRLRGARFEWGDAAAPYKRGKPDIGLIAEEVEEVFPEMVKRNGEHVLGVDYAKFVPVLIESIRELRGEVSRKSQLRN